MTYEVYRYIFYGGAALAAIMFIVSVLIFIVFRIPSVINDLTGRTARKAIEDIRSQNEQSGNKIYKTSHVNRERGKLTDKISPSGKIIKNPSDVLYAVSDTEKFDTVQLQEQANANETTVLTNETEVLAPTGSDETTILDQTQEQNNIFVIEYEITFIHSDEIIV